MVKIDKHLNATFAHAKEGKSKSERGRNRLGNQILFYEIENRIGKK